MESVKIRPGNVPCAVYEAGCRLLPGSLRSFFSDGANRAAYEAWMRTPEGMAADEPGGGRGQSVKVPLADRTPSAAC